MTVDTTTTSNAASSSKESSSHESSSQQQQSKSKQQTEPGSFGSPQTHGVVKKSRAEVIRTIQDITKYDEFYINQAIEACLDSEGRYSMDQVLNVLMDEKYSNETPYSHQPKVSKNNNSSLPIEYQNLREDEKDKYFRGQLPAKYMNNEYDANVLQEDEKDHNSKSENKNTSEQYESDLFREEGSPAGLNNVGNTCWFNSIIQAFFNLQPFRRLILSFNIGQDDINKLDDNSKNVLDFVFELRKLFALMLKSKRKAINPNSTLRLLRKCSKYDVETFNQEDVSEFAMVLVNLIEDSFDILSKVHANSSPSTKNSFPNDVKNSNSKNQEQSLESYLLSLNISANDLQIRIDNENSINRRKNRENPIVNLLNGDIVVTRKNSEEDTTNFLIEIFREVNIQMLNSSNLHAGLELEWGETSIDRLSSPSAASSSGDPKIKEMNITAKKLSPMSSSFYEQESWLLKLPSVLFICLNRYKFVKATKSSSKIIEPFEFYPSIYLDRYVYSNKEIIKNKRKELKVYKNELKHLEDKLNSINNYKLNKEKAHSYSLDEILKGTLHFIDSDFEENSILSEVKNDQAILNSKEETDKLRNIINSWINRLDDKLNSLKSKIDEIKSKIDLLYEDECLKKIKYNLHSVCIHEGSTTLGHFWTYIWDSQKSKWYKFNDTEVCESNWDDLYSNAVGGLKRQRLQSESSSSDKRDSQFDMADEKTPSAYFLIYKKANDEQESQPTEPEELASDLLKYLSHDQEVLENQSNSLKLKAILKDLDEKLKKSNQLIANSNYQSQESLEQTKQTCMEHAKAFFESSYDALSESYHLILKKDHTDSEIISSGVELALKNAIDIELKKYSEMSKQVLSKLPEIDLRINHILIYFNANSLPSELKTIALYDLFRMPVSTESDIKLRILSTMAQIKYNEYVITNINNNGAAKTATSSANNQNNSDLIKQYEKWQSDYRDYRSIVAAFINAVNQLDLLKYDEALPFFCVACEYNERITNNLANKMKGFDHEFLLAARRKCFKSWSRVVLIRFKQLIQQTTTTNPTKQDDLTSLMEMMIHQFLPCFSRLINSSTEDKQLVDELRNDWLTALDANNFQDFQQFQDFMDKLFDDTIGNHFHSLNVNKSNLLLRYNEATNLIKKIK